MRDWNLAPGDPLALTLAADARHCPLDPANDHIWELEPGGGDPPAISLRTTYGLRARSMRVFARFILGGQALADPAEFAAPPVLRRFTPDWLKFSFAPVQNLLVSAEYRVPDGHCATGRFTISNQTGEPLTLLVELCAQLVPLEGQPMAAALMQSVNVLAGTSAGLCPVLFLTGGPTTSAGAYPALVLDLVLAAGGVRSLTWALAALAAPEDSFEHARRSAARPWEAEIARLEMTHASQSVEVETGDPGWDAAFALSQKTAFQCLFTTGRSLPQPSFVLARQPDHGYSPGGDGSDAGPLWDGQPALESLYLASLLPGAPELIPGLVRNFLATQAEDGEIDNKPGMAGQRGHHLCAPLLASLACEHASRPGGRKFLREVYPKLRRFLQAWLDPRHDRDGDGFPEWDHPLQTGLEQHPLFPAWGDIPPGGDIRCVESPGLGALLVRDLGALSRMAGELKLPGEQAELQRLAARLAGQVEACWDEPAAIHRLRDRDTHLSPPGKKLAAGGGSGSLAVARAFRHPTRLVVQIDLKGLRGRHPLMLLRGELEGGADEERLEQEDFHWNGTHASATTRGTFQRLDSLEVDGLEKQDRIRVLVMDFTCEDISLCLPLWAGIPSPERAADLVKRTILHLERFGAPFGMPCAAGAPVPEACQAVHLPWNALIGEGMLAYGMRAEAADLTTRLMQAVTASLRGQRAFYQSYHAASGAGMGERNALAGLAPLGLFLKTLGVEFMGARRVRLSGKNPFPWSVTVKYRGLTVRRHAESTLVVFPDSQTITLDDPTDAVVSLE